MISKRSLASIALIAIFSLANTTGVAFADTAPNSSVSQNTSLNWAGYVSTGSTYTAISGTWIVPSSTSEANTPISADATWVGIGGLTNSDLLQTGTQVVIQNGIPSYTAWVEALPNFQQTIPITIHAGDSITVSLTEQSANEWTLSFIDTTTGQNYQTTIPYVSSHSSAEWIEEMPLAVGSRNRASFIPLDNFGTVEFQNGSVTMNGTTNTIAGSNAQEMTMITSSNVALAVPSSLSNSNGFSITRSSVASAAIPGVSTESTGYGTRGQRNGNGVQGYIPRTGFGFGMFTRRGIFFRNNGITLFFRNSGV